MLTLSSLAGAINFIVTITNMRASGMTWTRMPLFVWTILTYAWLLILALPTLSAGLTMMLLDRNAGTHFFDPAHGGSPILYQHVFWFFGHPEVYIMVLPAMGIISEIIPVFARKPIFGYKAVAMSTVGIAFLGFLVWGHHMFAVGLPTAVDSFFMISSMMIAVPTGVKIFNWLATLWRGNISFDTPMLWALGFIALFTIGGLSGIFLAAFPVDWQLTQTYYVVAHIHYVLFGGSMFGIFGGLYYWWPKLFGRMLDEKLGKLHFWLVFIGFNLAFMPQHLLGLLGMPRRIYTYSEGGIWEVYNMISTIGAFTMAVGMLVFVAERGEDRTSRAAGRERPLARRHARVVRHLTAAAMELRTDPLHHQRPAASRPTAPADRGGPPVIAGPWTRLLAAAALAGTALAVISGAADWHTAHRLLAGLALPPLIGLLVIAMHVAAGASLPAAVAALVLFGLAALLTESTLHLDRRLARLRSHGAALAAQAFRGEPAGNGRAARLPDADQAARDVAAAADRRRRGVRRRPGRAGLGHVRGHDGRPRARLRRRRQR